MVEALHGLCERWPEAVVIGGSSGGFDALQRILSPLQADFALPIVAVLHRGPTHDTLLSSLLAGRCRLAVKEADDKEPLRPGVVYVAPPDYHVLVELERSLSLSVDCKVRFSRPSIDVLFETAADAFREGLVGILLTGANDDGTAGLLHIRRRGGLTVVQDPCEAESDLMPRAAIEAGAAQHVMKLTRIASLLEEIGGGRMVNG